MKNTKERTLTNSLLAYVQLADDMFVEFNNNDFIKSKFRWEAAELGEMLRKFNTKLKRACDTENKELINEMRDSMATIADEANSQVEVMRADLLGKISQSMPYYQQSSFCSLAILCSLIECANCSYKIATGNNYTYFDRIIKYCEDFTQKFTIWKPIGGCCDGENLNKLIQIVTKLSI